VKYRLLIPLLTATLLAAACSCQPLFSPCDIGTGVMINETRRVIEISPFSGAVSATGLLFYPGGLVDSHVYNQILADFAGTAGALTVVVKMPGNLAVFDINAGLSVIRDYPEMPRWVIAGHSLGGSMAASVAKGSPETFEGLIFMDSYPADSASLADWQGAVLSLYSSEEKVSDQERLERTLALIPPAAWLTDTERTYPADKTNYTVIHQIDGGSHSFFGTYGPQEGDEIPTVSRESFHAEVIDYMTEFFTENGW